MQETNSEKWSKETGVFDQNTIKALSQKFEYYLNKGCSIVEQDNKWCLFDKDGEGLLVADSMQELLTEMVLLDENKC